MLLPLRHENMQGRRWPVITIGLIALNVLIFLATHWTIDEQRGPEAQVRTHILLLAAMHPDLKMPQDTATWVNSVKTANPRLWEQIQDPNRRAIDSWDAQHRIADDSTDYQQEMDSLSQQLEDLQRVSIQHKYAFYPTHPKATSYITANFLHAGWLHLIGNMWFLWLAGFILEDTWGRVIYPIFYLLAGAFALQVHAWFNPGSTVPLIGASGAVAALMGGFLTRFPTMKIEMIWIFGFIRSYRFKAAAYWLLPAWLLMEILYGSAFGAASGVAHWAHVGGFVFGAAAGYGIRVSGLENVAEQAIQDKIAWVSHPLLAEANEQLEKGELDAASANLKKLLVEKPDSIEAYRMLQQIYWRKNEPAACRSALQQIVILALKAKDGEEALRSYDDLKAAGGESLPAATWLELCRTCEDQQQLERAVNEYEALAKAFPAEKQSLLAQIAAGRLCLKRLNDPRRALAFYEAAAGSPIPHLDWETNIRNGIDQAKQALNAPMPA